METGKRFRTDVDVRNLSLPSHSNSSCRLVVPIAVRSVVGDRQVVTDHGEVSGDHREVGRDVVPIAVPSVVDDRQVVRDHVEVGRDHAEVGRDHAQVGGDDREVGRDHRGVGRDHGILCFRTCLELLGFADEVKLDNAVQSSGILRPVESAEDLVTCFLDARRYYQSLLNNIFYKEGLMLDNLRQALSCSSNDLCDMVERVKEEKRKETLASLLSSHLEESNCRACEGALSDTVRQKEVCRDMSGLVQCAESFYHGFSRTYCMKRLSFARLAEGSHGLYRSCMMQTHLVELSLKLFQGLEREIAHGMNTPFPPQLQENFELALPPDGLSAKTLSPGKLRVPDGDTLVYVDGEERLTIRIPDVDAHEKGDSFLFETDDGKKAIFDVGLEARRKLIGILYDCQEVILDMRSERTDGYQRTIREVWLRLAHDQPLKAASQFMLEQGQAFPYISGDAGEFDSKRFDLKWQWSKTRAKGVGICRFPEEVVQDKCLRPYSLRKCRKESIQLPTKVPINLGKSQRKAEQLLACTGLRSLTLSVVDVKKTWEFATFAKQSTIRNAGMGLFVEGRDCVISKGDRIAYYGNMASEEPETNTMTYVISHQSKTTKHCDALPVRSGALGRFANMAVPQEALFDLIRTSYTIGDDLSSVNKICAESANGKFSPHGNRLYIVAKHELDLRRGDTEIFVDYGFSDYWFGEVFSNPESFLESSPLLSTAIIFAICDKRSKMTLAKRCSLSRKDPTKFHHLLTHPSYSEDFIQGALSAKRR